MSGLKVIMWRQKMSKENNDWLCSMSYTFTQKYNTNILTDAEEKEAKEEMLDTMPFVRDFLNAGN